MQQTPQTRVEGTSSSAAATARTSLFYHRRGTPGLLCAGEVCGPSQQSTIHETGGASPPAAHSAGVGGALWRWCADSLLVHTHTHTQYRGKREKQRREDEQSGI